MRQFHLTARFLALACLPWALAGHTCSAATRSDTNLAARVQDTGVVIEVEGKLFTRYTFAPSQKYPYFWPVIGPLSGESVTIETSEPFPHHHSLFFGCDRVNGGNYWQEANERGQILSQGPKVAEAAGSRVSFTDECLWQQPGKEPIMRDRRRITITAPAKDRRVIDFAIALEPLVDINIQKTNHSLFSARSMPELSPKGGGTLINAEGQTGEKPTWGQASAWCALYGERKGATEGLAILQHPANRWFPAKWFTRDYGFMSPTPMYWPEGESTSLAKGETVTLRYRVLVFAGDVRQADVAGLYAAYARTAEDEIFTPAALAAALGRIKAYRYGQSREHILAVESLIRRASGSDERRTALEQALLAVLADEATTLCKQHVCEWLSEVGGTASVPGLVRLLGDKRLGDAARFALERVPGPQASTALRQALASAKDTAKPALVNSIAARGDAEAVPLLLELAVAPDAVTAAAAVTALGRIGGPEAKTFLLGRSVLTGAPARARTQARLTYAERALAEDRRDDARAILESMFGEAQPIHVRTAALRGLVRLDPDGGVQRVSSLLTGADTALRIAAAQLAAEVPGAKATAAFAERLPKVPPDTQLVLLAALATRGDRAAAPAVAALTQGENEGVRVAAVRALASLGGADDVPRLAALAGGGGTIGKAAAESLASLSGDGVAAAIITSVQAGAAATRAAAIHSMAARGTADAVRALVVLARDADATVREAAAVSLGKLAGPADLTDLVALVLQAGDPASRKALTEALARTAGRADGPDDAAAPVIAVLGGAKPDIAVALLGVLRRIGGDKAVTAIGRHLSSESADTRKAAIQALTECATDAPRLELLKAAETDANEVNRVLALRGFVKQLATFPDTPPEKAGPWLRRAMAAALRPDEKKTILACLPGFVCDATIELAEGCLADTALQAEAKLALHKMKMDGIRKFDFQLKGAPLMHDFVEINRTTIYSPKRGVGWDKAPMDERDRKKGTDLTRDFVFDAAPRTFKVNLPNADYIVTVFMGDMANGHDLAEIHAEGELKHKGITTRAGEVKELTFPVTVKDGVLDILFRDGGGGNEHWTCPGLIIGN